MTHILVVEDDPALRRSLTLNLTARGYSVDETGNGEDALRLAGRRVPDIVLVDLGLPTMSGLEVIRGLRVWADMPIIVLSTESSDDKIGRARKAGADGWIVKPFDPAQLFSAVRQAAPKRSRR